jgi:hypothetical protein
MNIPFQILWALYLFFISASVFLSGFGWAAVLFVVASIVWLVASFALITLRKWCWWVCVVANLLLCGIGIAIYGSLVRWGIYAGEISYTEHEVAVALLGGAFYLIPSAVLLWNLFALRRRAKAGDELDG